MSERRRAFLALRGDHFPRVGDRGLFCHGFEMIAASFSDDEERIVEVLRVSATGATIWTRFVDERGQKRFGMDLKMHRWSRSENDIYYGAGTHAPVGEVSFR